MRNIDTVIFDLDGTLLNTLDDLAKSVNYALEKHCLPLRSMREIRSFLGNGIRFLMKKSVGECIAADEEQFNVVFRSFKEYYMAHCLDSTKPYDGIINLLQNLKEKKYKMAIVSNKLQPAVTELNKYFFYDLIPVAIGESANVRRKPYPDSVIEAIKQLGSSTKTTVYIGDSEVDIETAKKAEISCISVLWGFRDEAFMREKFPDAFFAENPHDIEVALNGL